MKSSQAERLWTSANSKRNVCAFLINVYQMQCSPQELKDKLLTGLDSDYNVRIVF